MEDAFKVPVIEGGKTLTWALALTKPERHRITLALRDGSGRAWEATGGDAFDALMKLRLEVEPDGIQLCCNGARRNAWSSGMQRDMGEGFMTYLLSLGEHGVKPPSALTPRTSTRGRRYDRRRTSRLSRAVARRTEALSASGVIPEHWPSRAICRSTGRTQTSLSAMLQSRPVHIRPARADDVPTLHRALMHAFNWDATRKPLPVEHPVLARYRDDWGRPGDLGVVAETDGEPVGAAYCRLVHGYGFVDDRTPEVTIGVDTACRGQGIGAALLAALAELAKAKGIERMSLSVEPTNPALRLYLRAGYLPVATDEGGSVTMSRTL